MGSRSSSVVLTRPGVELKDARSKVKLQAVLYNMAAPVRLSDRFTPVVIIFLFIMAFINVIS
jgi:hypothetical protein